MSRFIFRLSVVLAFLFPGAGLLSQTTATTDLPYPEQIYVQLNQELFLSGDTLWAGIQVLEAQTGRPSQLSNVAYFEIWADGSAIVRQRVILDRSAAMAAISLPADLRSGTYLVRAYTRWMRNEGMFFHHWIRIVNPTFPPPVRQPGDSLYPGSVEIALEGGHVIANQQHSLHIRTQSWDQVPMSTSAILVTTAQDTIKSFQTNARGYYKLEFEAHPETEYQLLVKTSSEVYEAISLGTTESDGVGMRIVEEAGEPWLEIVGGEDQFRYEVQLSMKERSGMRQFPLISFRSDEGRRIRIAELEPGDGPIQFILSDEQGSLIGTCFLPPSTEMPLTQKPAPAGSTTSFMTTGIIGRQPIGMQEYKLYGLPGLIPSHAQEFDYFEEWLPFAANQTVSQPEPLEHLLKAETMGIILEGSVKDEDDNPIAGEPVYLAFPGDIAWFHIAVTDSNGLFHFVVENEFGQPASTILKGGKRFKSTWTISLHSGFAEAPEIDKWPALAIDQNTWDQLEGYYHRQQLATRYLDPEYEAASSSNTAVTAPIYGQPNFTYRFADYTTMPTEEAFIEYISQAYFRKPNKIKTLYLLNTERDELFPGPPMLMIDGVPVNTTADIVGVNYRLVDRIELVTVPYLINGQALNGILNLITYQKDASSVTLKEGELRAELLIVPTASSAHNRLLAGDHIPTLEHSNDIYQDGSIEENVVGEPRQGSTIWIQTLDEEGRITERLIGED